MLSRPAVAIFITMVIEYVVATQLAGVIGGQAVALLVIASIVVGVVVLRRAAAEFVEASVATAVKNSGLDQFAGDRLASAPAGEGRAADRAMQTFGALLLIVPGVVTSLFGLAFLLPPVRAVARPFVLHRIQPWIRPNLRFARGPMGFRRDVVDVDLVVDDAADEPPSSRAELS